VSCATQSAHGKHGRQPLASPVGCHGGHGAHVHLDLLCARDP
jgi:hypothetical protein